jgi:hypothetical protein
MGFFEQPGHGIKHTLFMTTNTARTLIRDHGAFVALATVVLSLLVVPSLDGQSQLAALVISGAFALACVDVLVARLQSPPQIE